MIEPVVTDDLPAVKSLIEATVVRFIPLSAPDHDWLMQGIMKSLDRWEDTPDDSLHVKCVLDGRIVGVLLLQNAWNLTNLFVDPEHHRRGIGRTLLAVAIEHASEHGDTGCIKLNSSTFAVSFYEANGFVQIGPGKDRPGGCIPMELTL